MVIRSVVYLGAVLLFCALSSQGDAVAKASGDHKYAVVDMQSVILNVTDGKKARDNLQSEIKSKEQALLAEKTELDKLNKDWQTQAALLSETARFKKQQEFQERFLKLRNAEMSFQNDIKKKEQMATQKIAIEVTKLVNKMAEERGFEMVFETSSAGLVYLKDPIDITKMVTTAYEQQSVGKAPKTAKKSE